MIITNVLQFTVEFLKMYLGAVGIFKMKQKKKVFFFYLAAVLLITTLTIFLNVVNRSFIFIIIIMLILGINAQNYKKVWILPVIYLVVSMIDVLNSLVFIRCFGLTLQQMQNSPILYIGINCITLVELFAVYGAIRTKRKDAVRLPAPTYASLYILGGISALIYLTCAQLSLLNAYKSTYHNLWLAGLVCSGIVFLIIGVLLFRKTNENELLKYEQSMNRKMLDAQANYYTLLLEKNKEIRAFRHDIKNHLYCMALLAENGQYEELKEYLTNTNQSLEHAELKINTGNEMVSAILMDLMMKYKEVQCDWQGKLKSPFILSNYDICTIFYNLLCNAFEAAEKSVQKEVHVQVRYLNAVLYLKIRNTYEKKPVKNKEGYVTSKTEGDHGFGISNAQAAIEENGGTCEFQIEEDMFLTEIVLPEVKGETSILG